MEDLIHRLKLNDRTAYKEVYTSSYKICAAMVFKHGGDEETAKDIFQEAMIIFINKIRQPDFDLTSKISTFLYSICRNLWLQEWNNQSRSKTSYILDEYGVDLFDNIAEETVDKEKKQSLLQHTMKVLQNFGKEDCREIIKLYYFDNLSLRQIATNKGYTEAYAKRKKFNCMSYFKKEIYNSLPPSKSNTER